MANEGLRPLLAAMMRPLLRFFRLEAASGLLLLGAAAVALGLANSPAAFVYRGLAESLHAPVNEGLMAVFFFLVGMEIKHELVAGELRTFGRAVLPALAALGGMAVPAAIFALLNRHGIGARGWAIPMATDIAFAIGTLTLLKGRVPTSLVVFVTALAIFDDIGGIAVIAVFYGRGIGWQYLAATAAAIGVLALLARSKLQSIAVYLCFGPLLWWLLLRSGIHPTLAGVALGLAIPGGSRPLQEMEQQTPEAAELLDETTPLSRLISALHPWVAFGIMPLFALVNSGVSLHGFGLDSLRGPVLLGAALGLFVGKQLGVFGFTLSATALGISPLPEGGTRAQLYGASIVAGIGFTVALFIADLAFAQAPELLGQAKLGILLGSVASGAVGMAVLRALSGRGSIPSEQNQA
jgi:Na+:H+ antiporter, NhaA family